MFAFPTIPSPGKIHRLAYGNSSCIAVTSSRHSNRVQPSSHTLGTEQIRLLLGPFHTLLYLAIYFRYPLIIMNDLQAMHASRDDWEDWSDDDTATTTTTTATTTDIRHNNPFFIQSSSADTLAPPKTHSQSTARRSKARQSSSSKLQRLKSRKRQKHQNEKLGIRLVTDMTNFRKGPHHVAQLVYPASGPASSEANINKFADASALRALEGSPNLASVGNWAWLKDNQSPVTPSPDAQHYSPNGNKIVIGMAVPEQDAANRAISPQTATIATPTNRLPTQSASSQSDHHHQNSTWSPDTEDGYSPARYQQNIYAQSTGQNFAHPVPAIPSHLKNSTKASEVDDDDDFTPVTLFEEDGRKSPTSAVSKISPETTRSRSGWWDHVKTPFKERFSPTSRFEKDATSPDEWWKGADKKTGQMSKQNTASDASSSTLRPTVPIIREPSPTIASSSRSSPPSSIINERQQQEPRCAEKAGVMTEEHADPADVPPPYEHTPSSKQEDVRLRAMFPPGHYLASQFPPSPMPGSPGFDKSMRTGQQGDVKMAYMNMSDVPLTPARTGAESTHSAVDAPLPDRVAGTYVGDQHQEVHGDSPAAQIEKTRRRHEKEDYLARKVGGAWKGRGCLNGCYGRSGREGRQRRRFWLWICLAFWLVTIVAVVLGVVLSRKLAVVSAPASSSDASGSSATSSPDTTSSDTPEKTSVWLNLTSFPPIPTGLATVVGADNSEAITGCVAPETLWSCSLPPEQQAANEPSDANQPTFIFQIQYDNNTRMLWDIPNGDAPTPATTSSSSSSSTVATTSSSSSTQSSAAAKTTSATSSAASATATDDLTGSAPGRRSLTPRDDDDTLYDTGIAPNPSPPSFDEMWFLGNWTDGIVSANKSGEPTPFYISFFTSLNGSAGANMLTDSTTTKRGGVGAGSGTSLTDALPAPIVNADGTGAAAQLRPFPFQQPLRLFDRGLPTEHYGFYSYFNKTIYVSTMDNTSTVTSSNEGGVLETSAGWYATWTQTRFVVKIWTAKQQTSSNPARLIGSGGGGGNNGAASSSSNTTSPGSFPYPITIGEDTHGGDLQLKQTFAYGVEADQVINTTLATTFVNNIGYGSAVVNPAFPDGDLSWGGTDGGKGGCRCEWVNWVDADGNADETFA